MVDECWHVEIRNKRSWHVDLEPMACLRWESARVLMLLGHHFCEGKPSLPRECVSMWKFEIYKSWHVEIRNKRSWHVEIWNG